MTNPFLTNNSLINFIETLKIGKEKKDFLLSKILQLDKEEREKLFIALKNIYLLDLEKEGAIKKIKDQWQGAVKSKKA